MSISKLMLLFLYYFSMVFLFPFYFWLKVRTICSSLLAGSQNSNSLKLHFATEIISTLQCHGQQYLRCSSLSGLRNCLDAWLIHTNYASNPCWCPAFSLLDAVCVSQASRSDWIVPVESLLDTKFKNIAEWLKLIAKHFKKQK